MDSEPSESAVKTVLDVGDQQDNHAQNNNVDKSIALDDSTALSSVEGEARPTSFLEAFGYLRETPAFATTAPRPLPPVEAIGLLEEKANADTGPPVHVRAALAHARARTTLLAAPRQRDNPMLRHIRHVRVAFDSDIIPDFVCGPTTAVLYLSLQYHNLHPKYIYERVREIGRAYRLRILLVLVDVDDHRRPVHELTKLSLLHDLTLICAGSEREAARYCETFRSYDGKTADSIQERVGEDYTSKLTAALCSVRGVNKTDAATLAFTFGALKNLASASEEELRRCPGMGERKVARLYAALNQPFRTEESWNRPCPNGEDADI
jgi:DNA excision repair protein ERCC-1